jgi:hypothetical protein
VSDQRSHQTTHDADRALERYRPVGEDEAAFQ